MNSITISGTVTRFRQNETQTGKTVTNIGLKVEQERDGKTYIDGFFDVVAWRPVEVAEGDEVIVNGRLKGTKHYKQDAEGKDIWTAEIDATFGDVVRLAGTMPAKISGGAPAGADAGFPDDSPF